MLAPQSHRDSSRPVHARAPASFLFSRRSSIAFVCGLAAGTPVILGWLKLCAVHKRLQNALPLVADLFAFAPFLWPLQFGRAQVAAAQTVRGGGSSWHQPEKRVLLVFVYAALQRRLNVYKRRRMDGHNRHTEKAEMRGNSFKNRVYLSLPSLDLVRL
jgi:hypothetical protein